MKYSIDGNVDFFKELQEIQNSIDNNDNNDNNNHDNNTCLLTGDKLLPDAVELQCGHKFNYSPLFAEVVLQKCTVLPKNIASSDAVSYYNTSLNLETTKLNYNQVKCPYCRTITPYLLPYYPYPHIKQIRYVNAPSNLCMPCVKCGYYASKSIEKECGNTPTYDEKYGLLCKTHLKCVITTLTKTNSNKVLIGKTKLNTKTPASSKSSLATPNNDNTIVSITDTMEQSISLNDCCTYTLTTGSRKGGKCGAKSYKNHHDDDMLTEQNAIVGNNTSNDTDKDVVLLLCKRHYNMLHKP